MQKKVDRKIPSKGMKMRVVLPISLLLLIVIFYASLIIGTKTIDPSIVWDALLHRNPDYVTHQIIWEIRLPRALMATLVGAYLAVSGAVMQALTRNPLAEPSLLGVSNGAAFALVLSLTVFSGLSIMGSIIASMAGAGIAVLLVFSLSALSRGGITPVKLALAGTAIAMFLSSLTTSVALYFDVSKNISFWYAGELANSHWQGVKMLAAVGLIGLPILFSIAHALTLLSLGTDVTKGLGINIKLVRFLGVIVILLLTGSSVAVSGTIGFIGLVIPHITRMTIGVDYRKLLPIAAILGSALLVLADVASRMINPPYETPVGVMTAAIGVPFFLYLVRSEGRQLFW